MPTYVYKFIDTGETIEVQQAFTDDALSEYPHPSDGKPRPVKKVFQPVGVTFKGGGFYKTDSRSSSASSSTSTSASTPASDTSSAAASSAPTTTPSSGTSTGTSTSSASSGPSSS